MAKKEGRVSGYSSGLVVGAADALVKAFKGKYDIAVEFISSQTPAQLEGVRTEYAAGKLITSFAGLSQTQLVPLRNNGTLEPRGGLPSLAEKDVWFFPPQYDQAGTFISFGKYWVLSYVNTNLVKPEDEPRSYLDLLKPQWKGKMVAPDLSVPMFAVTYASLKYHKPLEMDDFYRRLGQQGVSFRASLADAATALARGEASVYISAHETYLTRFVAEGAQ